MAAEASPMLNIRGPIPGSRDLLFVENSWNRCLCRDRPAHVTRDKYGRVLTCVQVPAGQWMRGMGIFIRGLFASEDARVLIASPRATPRLVAGWIVWQPARVLFFYTVGEMRRRGIAAALWRAVIDAETRNGGTGEMKVCFWTPVLDHLRLPAGWTVDETGVLKP